MSEHKTTAAAVSRPIAKTKTGATAKPKVTTTSATAATVPRLVLPTVPAPLPPISAPASPAKTITSKTEKRKAATAAAMTTATATARKATATATVADDDKEKKSRPSPRPLWDRECHLDGQQKAEVVCPTFAAFLKLWGRRDSTAPLFRHSGAGIVGNWAWRPSYRCAVDNKIEEVLDFFATIGAATPTDTYAHGDASSAEERATDTRCHLHYCEQDYLVVHYTGLWNSNSCIYKVYVDAARDTELARAFFTAEARIAAAYLTPPS